MILKTAVRGSIYNVEINAQKNAVTAQITYISLTDFPVKLSLNEQAISQLATVLPGHLPQGRDAQLLIVTSHRGQPENKLYPVQIRQLKPREREEIVQAHPEPYVPPSYSRLKGTKPWLRRNLGVREYQMAGND